VEVRRYWTVTVPPEITEAAKWKGLQTIGMVESERHIGAKVTRETRFYISSLDRDAKRFGRAVRGHWGIENSLHWSLDVTFNEDGCRIRQGQAAENFSVLRHLALNLLQQDKTTRLGIKAKRFKAALDPQYLAKLLITQ
jgi:predicted transposase YbfD/YdcC